MDLRTLKDTPPWDWPRDAASMSSRFSATATSMNVTACSPRNWPEIPPSSMINWPIHLLSIARSRDETEELRGKAVIALGPVLEHADTAGFEDTEDILISEETFRRIQESLRKLFLDADIPKDVRRNILRHRCEPRRLASTRRQHRTLRRRRILEAHGSFLHAFHSRIR